MVYNFAGIPGDLYQLVPDKFLATLGTVLNRDEPASAEVWDRSNLVDAARLAPTGSLAALLRSVGGQLFRQLWATGRPAKTTAVAFQVLNKLAEKQASAASKRLIETDAEAMLQNDVRAVFVNLRHGPGFADSLDLARLLRRERPGIRLFAIGHRASWFSRELARLCSDFDAMVVGPSSYATMAALARGAHPSQLKNTTYRCSGDVVSTERDFCDDLEDDVIPDYSPHLYRGVEGHLPLREVVLANEACPFACHFCIRPVTYGTTWRARDVACVVDEVEHHLRVEGIRCFRFSDSTPPPGMLTAVAREILERGLHEHGLHISSFGRVNRRMREDYAVLRQAGFEAMFFGVESGSPRMLDGCLGKKLTVEEVGETIKLVHEAGLKPVASFIFPAPGETAQSKQETLDLLAELKPYLGSALVQPAGIYPGTPWHTDAERFGVHLHDDYVRRAVTYPIEPLKPLRFWQPFPFSYDLMGTPGSQVRFPDIVACFSTFVRKVWGNGADGGLGLANVQDYGFVLARQLGCDPVALSRQATQHMVTRDLAALGQLCGVAPRAAGSAASRAAPNGPQPCGVASDTRGEA